MSYMIVCGLWACQKARGKIDFQRIRRILLSWPKPRDVMCDKGPYLYLGDYYVLTRSSSDMGEIYFRGEK